MLNSLFWATANSNFLDIGILEWCKLFTDSKNPHFWRNVVENPASFESELYARLGVTPEEFNSYRRNTKTYRDKFVAHLDSESVMHIPQIDLARESVFYYHTNIASTAQVDAVFTGLPRDIRAYYDQCTADALAVYK